MFDQSMTLWTNVNTLITDMPAENEMREEAMKHPPESQNGLTLLVTVGDSWIQDDVDAVPRLTVVHEDGVHVVSIDCNPRSSVGIWPAMSAIGGRVGL